MTEEDLTKQEIRQLHKGCVVLHEQLTQIKNAFIESDASPINKEALVAEISNMIVLTKKQEKIIWGL